MRDSLKIARGVDPARMGVLAAGALGAYFLALSLCDAPLLRVLSLTGAGAAVVMVRRIDYLLVLLMISSLVTRGPVNIVGDITPFDVLVVLMGLHISVRLMRKRAVLSVDAKLMVLLVLLVCLTELLGFFYFPRHLFLDVSLKPFIQLMEFLVVFLAVALCLNDEEQIKRIALWQIGCAAFLAAVAVYESYRGVIMVGTQSVFGTNEYLLHGELKSNPNTLLLIIPAVAFLAYGPWRRPARLALVGLILFPLIPQGTRTFYLALVGVVFGMLWQGNFRKPGLVLPVVLLAVFVNSGVVIPKVGEVFRGAHSYFVSPYSAGDTSTFGRLALWQTAATIFLKHPLWGYGVNGYGMEMFLDRSTLLDERIAFASWIRGDMNPAGKTHNEYLQILLDHGAIAFALSMYLLFRALRVCGLKAKASRGGSMAGIYRALFVSVVSFLFAFMGVSLLSYHGNNFLQVFFWLNLGLIYAPVSRVKARGPGLIEAARTKKAISTTCPERQT